MSERSGPRLSTILEVVSAAAVVLSLIYVAIEIRRNTEAVQSATYQQLVAASDEFLLVLAQDPELTDIWIRGDEDPSLLNDIEAQRYWWIVRTYLRNMEHAFRQHERGLLGDLEWDLYASMICKPWPQGRRLSWVSHSPTLSPDFVSFVESCQDFGLETEDGDGS